jgi:predicted enzyme related to lactoylglutathione lyase
MPARVSHVAINADDLPASLAFYETVFGWRFDEDYPGFFRMECSHEVRVVAVQQRRDLLPDGPTTGFECTVGVDDLAAAIEAALANGGRVLAAPATIPGVGTLAWLADPAGNVVGAMRYDVSAT